MVAYNIQHAYCIRQMVILEHVIEKSIMDLTPIPFMSAFISDCIDKGKDVMEGGAHYNFVGPEGVGVATVADSLACIKKLVFEEKKLSMAELSTLLANNFENDELKRQLLLNRAPKYGNDDDYVDLIAREIAAKYCNEVEQYKGVRGGVFSPGLYTTTNHVPMGAVVGATPDGRLAESPLNDGVSPAQGRDISGPTASLKSVTKLDQVLVSNGILLNFKIDPLSIEDDASLDKFINLLTAYFKLGGQHIQINCICADTLRDAQKNPQNYADLVIRVAGYSAYFTSLDKSLQDDLISRTEHHL
jgi:formate C-acetyltransferase